MSEVHSGKLRGHVRTPRVVPTSGEKTARPRVDRAASRTRALMLRPHRERLMEMALLEPLEAICRALNVRLDSVLSVERTRRVMEARTACCLYLRSLRMSYSEIGHILLRDHTSIVKAVATHRKKERKNGSPPAGETP